MVVGGDEPVEPKVRELLAAGARVTLVAASATPTLTAWTDAGVVAHLVRDYQSGDLVGAVIAYASSHDPALIRQLEGEAAREHVLLNVIDTPAACGFISPAVVRRGDLTIAIGTGGASPRLSARVRARLAEELGPEYGPYVAILGAVRTALQGHPQRTRMVTELVDSPTLLGLVRAGDRGGIDALLAVVTGGEHTLDRLGVPLDGKV